MVSYRRYCCRQMMRLYADSDALTEVTWYWAADDAAAVDLPNIAYDRTWQFLEGHQPTMGEQLARPPYYRGVPPVDAPGRAPCGDAKAWAGLASISDGGLALDPATGLPECCGGDVYPINTGVLLGGELEVESIEHVAGGVALGGEIEVPGLVDGVALGGEIEVPGLVDGVALGGELEIPIPIPVTDACSTVGTAARYWTIPAVPASNSACSDCGNVDVARVAEHVSGCLWQTPDFVLCGVNDRWNLQVSGSSTFLFNGQVSYRVNTSAFDPLGPTTLDRFSVGSGCADWPLTITIEPAPAP